MDRGEDRTGFCVEERLQVTEADEIAIEVKYAAGLPASMDEIQSQIGGRGDPVAHREAVIDRTDVDDLEVEFELSTDGVSCRLSSRPKSSVNTRTGTSRVPIPPVTASETMDVSKGRR